MLFLSIRKICLFYSLYEVFCFYKLIYKTHPKVVIGMILYWECMWKYGSHRKFTYNKRIKCKLSRNCQVISFGRRLCQTPDQYKNNKNIEIKWIRPIAYESKTKRMNNKRWTWTYTTTTTTREKKIAKKRKLFVWIWEWNTRMPFRPQKKIV